MVLEQNKMFVDLQKQYKTVINDRVKEKKLIEDLSE